MKPLKECRVLVTPTSYATTDPSLKTDLEEKVAEVVYNTTGKPLSSDQLQAMLPGIDGLIAGLDAIDEAALAAARDLKVVARYGVGVNNVDLEAAQARGVIVTNTPGANSKSVAELTVALMLMLVRPVIKGDQLTKQGQWPRLKGFSLDGRRVGLYGLGAIGKEVARRLTGFGCHVQAFDIEPDPSFAAAHQLNYVSQEELVASSDLLSLHLPSNPQTRGLVDADFISRMKTGAWLINTARGDLVEEGALVQALQSGQLRGAALDVFYKEPPDQDNPLLKLNNVITTPHMGAHADSATNNMGRMSLAECLRVLSGQDPQYRVV